MEPLVTLGFRTLLTNTAGSDQAPDWRGYHKPIMVSFRESSSVCLIAVINYVSFGAHFLVTLFLGHGSDIRVNGLLFLIC